MTRKISDGVVHTVPADLRRMIAASPAARATWDDITAIARNEWICWIEDAKRPETRTRRIARARAELREGKRRPCCWSGCPHR